MFQNRQNKSIMWSQLSPLEKGVVTRKEQNRVLGVLITL